MTALQALAIGMSVASIVLSMAALIITAKSVEDTISKITEILRRASEWNEKK